MAIGRISGPMLRANLERQGVDLSIETDLLYVDVNNNRIGINKAVPTVEFDLTGDAIFNDNLQISGTTITSLNTNGNIFVELNGSGTLNVSNLTNGRVVFVGADGALIDSENLTFDGANLTIGGNTVIENLNLGNLEVIGNTLTSINTNENIVLDPNGTGTVNVDTLTESRVVFVGTDGALVDSPNLTFDGNNLYIGGDSVLNTATLGNISITDNTISSTNTNDDIVLDPNGIGNVIIDSATPDRVFYSGSSKELLTSSNLTYNGSVFGIDNISISSNTISSTDTNGDITIDLDGTGQLIIQGTNAVTVPSGSTLQRPAGTTGDIRVNSDTGNFEFYDGTGWQIVSPSQTTVSLIDNFNGDGSTVSFTLSQSTATAATIVTLNGVVQSPGNAYNVTGTTLTFTEAPRTGDDIEVRYIANSFVPEAGPAIIENNTAVTVDDDTATIVSTINGSNVVVTTTSSTTFSGSILGTGSVASISSSVPSSSSDTGTKGEIAYDSSYVYICVDTDTWIRSSIENSF